MGRTQSLMVFIELGGFALLILLLQYFLVAAGVVIVFAAMIWPKRASDGKNHDAEVNTGRRKFGMTGSIRGVLAALGVVLAIFGLYRGSSFQADCERLPIDALKAVCGRAEANEIQRPSEPLPTTASDFKKEMEDGGPAGLEDEITGAAGSLN